MRIADEDPELELVHLLVKCTIPQTSIIGLYLDIEQRQDKDGVSRVCHKFTTKVELALDRGEAVIILGDFNRPLQTIRQMQGQSS